VTKIIAISGSLRVRSFNTAMLEAAQRLFPENIVMGSIEEIPLYNEDVEAEQGIPPAVDTLKNLIADANGLMIATPEYNNSMPGVLKNATDWLTRPPSDMARVFHDKPVAVMGATPGGFGTVLAQNSLLPLLRTLKTRPWFEGRLMVSRAHTLVDDEGRISDEEALKRLEHFVSGFISFCAD